MQLQRYRLIHPSYSKNSQSGVVEERGTTGSPGCIEFQLRFRPIDVCFSCSFLPSHDGIPLDLGSDQLPFTPEPQRPHQTHLTITRARTKEGEMESLGAIGSSLSQVGAQDQAEKDLSAAFKVAAASLTGLFKVGRRATQQGSSSFPHSPRGQRRNLTWVDGWKQRTELARRKHSRTCSSSFRRAWIILPVLLPLD